LNACRLRCDAPDGWVLAREKDLDANVRFGCDVDQSAGDCWWNESVIVDDLKVRTWEQDGVHLHVEWRLWDFVWQVLNEAANDEASGVS
jgi:hypothetical protein